MSGHTEPKEYKFTYGNCMGMWVSNVMMAWVPLILVTFLTTGIWRIVLTVLAAIWLLSAASTARFTPVARFLPGHLVAGGAAIIVLGIVGTDSSYSVWVVLFIMAVFINAPRYMKYGESQLQSRAK